MPFDAHKGTFTEENVKTKENVKAAWLPGERGEGEIEIVAPSAETAGALPK